MFLVDYHKGHAKVQKMPSCMNDDNLIIEKCGNNLYAACSKCRTNLTASASKRRWHNKRRWQNWVWTFSMIFRWCNDRSCTRAKSASHKLRNNLFLFYFLHSCCTIQVHECNNHSNTRMRGKKKQTSVQRTQIPNHKRFRRFDFISGSTNSTGSFEVVYFENTKLLCIFMSTNRNTRPSTCYSPTIDLPAHRQHTALRAIKTCFSPFAIRKIASKYERHNWRKEKNMQEFKCQTIISVTLIRACLLQGDETLNGTKNNFELRLGNLSYSFSNDLFVHRRAEQPTSGQHINTTTISNTRYTHKIATCAIVHRRQFYF